MLPGISEERCTEVFGRQRCNGKTDNMGNGSLGGWMGIEEEDLGFDLFNEGSRSFGEEKEQRI